MLFWIAKNSTWLQNIVVAYDRWYSSKLLNITLVKQK